MNNPLTELEDLNPEEVFNNAVMAAVKLPGARVTVKSFLGHHLRLKLMKKRYRKL